MKDLLIIVTLAIIQGMAIKLGWYFVAGMVVGASYFLGAEFGEKK
jgi:hypothetical protein